jgi:hypothetical protein
MLKWIRVLFAILMCVSPAFASSGWNNVRVSAAVSGWSQVQETGSTGASGWNGSVVAAEPTSRCRRICRRECQELIEEVCNDFGVECKTFARVVCNVFCEELCDELYP